MKLRHPSKYLSQALSMLGESVGRHPRWYIAISVAISLLMATGLQRGRLEDNMERLYFDFSSDAGDAWRMLDRHFPVNFTEFQPDR
jgi:uncharacterized membrane protein YdfJ with MMPL/SSD domain